MRIAISSGHGLHVRGARGLIDEVDEARLVTDRVSAILRDAGVSVSTFHENTARNQRDNVNSIVAHHNRQTRDLDVSIHFNSTTTGAIEERGIGVEVMYRTGNTAMRTIASRVARAISEASGLIFRRVDGTFPSTNIGFLNNTRTSPNINRAILIEVCFVVSRADVRLYQKYFQEICHAIASAITGRTIAPLVPVVTPAIPEPPPVDIPGYEYDEEECEVEEVRFETINDMPEWARTDIQKLIDADIIRGRGTNANGELILNMHESTMDSVIASMRMVQNQDRIISDAR